MGKSNARLAFEANKKDIDILWEIHTSLAGNQPGKRNKKLEVLNRSAIVFITACWESFIEDLAIEAFDSMINNAQHPTNIPMKVRNFSTKSIFEQKNSTKIWDLAESGWKTILNQHKSSVITHWLGDFNTPKTAQINNLYEELLGIVKISNSWYWKKMSTNQSSTKLDNFIQIRGNIAHRTQHITPIRKDTGINYILHVENLVNLTERKVFNHLKTIINIDPW